MDEHPIPSPARVCLVDDHSVLREQVGVLLDGAGYEVVAAVGTCEEGFHAVRAFEPFAAIIDNHLPDGLGVDLCRRLSVAVPSVRLIVHTAVLAPDLEAEAARAGAWAVVGKSIRGAELFAALQAFESPLRDLR